jgi:hypothetical protein
VLTSKHLAPILPATAERVSTSSTRTRRGQRPVQGYEPTSGSQRRRSNNRRFARVDLRIARIVAAGHVEGAAKLLQLTLDVGEGRHRTRPAGIKSGPPARGDLSDGWTPIFAPPGAAR